MTDSSPGLCGLVNFGNTCYMNSAIQCLGHLDKFRKYFISKEFGNDVDRNKPEVGLVVQWYKLIDGMWQDKKIIQPQSFRNEVRMLALKQGIHLNLVGNGQNDVQEFLLFLINNLHNSLSRKVNMTISGEIKNENDKMALQAYQSWKQFFKDDYSYIVSLFYGQISSNIYSLSKKKLSTTYEPQCYLTLPIPENKEEISIYDCLDLYTSYEKLEGENKWYDEKQKEYIECYKQIKFWKCPDNLIVVFKRFNNRGHKNEAHIQFPIQKLDLSRYSIGYGTHKNIYHLKAISNHIGGLNSGHYFAYCKHTDKKWYEFNDTQVSEIDKKILVSARAYCLFYEKIN